jgi:hypothetical protein
VYVSSIAHSEYKVLSKYYIYLVVRGERPLMINGCLFICTCVGWCCCVGLIDVVFYLSRRCLACVGWDVDTSLFLRTIVNLETLNGQNRWEPGLERCLCVLEVLTLQGRTRG